MCLGDWTHAVKKAKRQLYWLPKFKYANRYANPFLPELNDQLDLSIAAIERYFNRKILPAKNILDINLNIFWFHRMSSVDPETKIYVNFTKDIPNDQEDTWIAWGQSTKQKLLLRKHDKSIPLYAEGPFLMWMKDKKVEYFVLKTDENLKIDDFHRDDADSEFCLLASFFSHGYLNLKILIIYSSKNRKYF